MLNVLRYNLCDIRAINSILHPVYRITQSITKMAGIIEKFGVTSGKSFRLENYRTDDPGTMKKKAARGDLEDFQADLSEYQERLYAEDSQSLIIVFPGDGCRWQRRRH